MPSSPCYSTRFDRALALAASAFRQVRRKGKQTPYIAHLLHVAATVAEQGGGEDQVIAALLHDYLEDVPGASAELLRSEFGERVSALVLGLSDSTAHPKPPWKERKVAYLDRLRAAPPELKLIAAADKLHNAASLLRDLQAEGPRVWGRFNAPREGTIWYYREACRALGRGWSHPLLEELRRVVERLDALP